MNPDQGVVIVDKVQVLHSLVITKTSNVIIDLQFEIWLVSRSLDIVVMGLMTFSRDQLVLEGSAWVFSREDPKKRTARIICAGEVCHSISQKQPWKSPDVNIPRVIR